MLMAAELKPLGPYFKGQIVGYVDVTADRSNQCEVGGEWYVVNTEPRHEVLARGEIAQLGLVPYVPMIAGPERHGRGQVRSGCRPMFPSYMLVKCVLTDANWQAVRSARGVRRFLGAAGKPFSISAHELEVIRFHEADLAEKEAERLRLEDAAKLAQQGGKSGIVWYFSPGDRVRIKNGPFAGFYAELESAVDSRDRVRALVKLFGTRSPADLSAFDVEAL